jgi:BirA family transcriptional regulator, biotin operon repressor / biotin---[acetyl-CoA-carboxylase] ligase
LYKIPANTLFMGKNLVYVPECHSTNTLASQLCQRAATAEGTVVITDNQTNGRGQRGNVWLSDPHKNLTFSIILKPTFLRPSDQFNLTIAISLALRDFLTHRKLGVVKIKWPNDILINDKKVCGILIENTLTGDVLQCSVVGIGLNVNQDSFLIDSASSMKVVAGQDFNLSDELSHLLEFLERRYLQLRSGKTGDLRNDYLSSLYGMGEQRSFMDAAGEMQGVIEGINPQGKLLIDTREGIKSYDLKEIRFME